MKREHWFLLAGLCIGLLLGGVKCSLNIKQSPTPDAAQAVRSEASEGEGKWLELPSVVRRDNDGR